MSFTHFIHTCMYIVYNTKNQLTNITILSLHLTTLTYCTLLHLLIAPYYTYCTLLHLLIAPYYTYLLHLTTLTYCTLLHLLIASYYTYLLHLTTLTYCTNPHMFPYHISVKPSGPPTLHTGELTLPDLAGEAFSCTLHCVASQLSISLSATVSYILLWQTKKLEVNDLFTLALKQRLTG